MITEDEIINQLAKAAGSVKLMCGMANNAAWLVVLDAYTQVRQMPSYQFKIRKDFKVALKTFKHYERRLIYAETNRFFCLEDMDESTRKKYGDITNSEYYEFWTGIGARMYIKTKDAVTSLQHKFYLALAAHGEDHAEEKAWAITAEQSLGIAVEVYENAMKNCSKDYNIPIRVMRMIFESFSLQTVRDSWAKACNNICKLKEEDLTISEHRNIEMGILYLMDAWADIENIYDSVNDASNDFMDIFRTKGELKKVLKEIREMKHEALEAYEQDR